jgi:hypothetical protein
LFYACFIHLVEVYETSQGYTWILCLVRIFVRRATGQEIPTQQHSPAEPLTWHSMIGRHNRHEHNPTMPAKQNKQNKKLMYNEISL